MDREILYRGRSWAGLWYEGIPVRASDLPYRICAISIPGKATMVQIEPGTLGQYTGLHDSTKWESLSKSEQQKWLENHTADEWKGKKIFEGDIIKYKGELLEVRYSDEQARFLTVFLNGVYDPNPTVTMAKGKVIGNIPDAREETEKALKK